MARVARAVAAYVVGMWRLARTPAGKVLCAVWFGVWVGVGVWAAHRFGGVPVVRWEPRGR